MLQHEVSSSYLTQQNRPALICRRAPRAVHSSFCLTLFDWGLTPEIPLTRGFLLGLDRRSFAFVSGSDFGCWELFLPLCVALPVRMGDCARCTLGALSQGKVRGEETQMLTDSFGPDLGALPSRFFLRRFMILLGA